MTNNDLADLFVTHIVNPYGIWGVNLSEKVDYECGNPLVRISRFLEKEYEKFAQKPQEPKYEIGQFVAVYCRSFRTWARGVIDDMYGENSVLVWLIDLGMHAAKITLPALLMPLSNEALKIGRQFVQKFGLYGVLPANLVSDLLFTSFEAKPGKFWLPGALKVMEEYIKQANDIKFLKKYVHTYSDGSEQIFGDIILTLGERVVSVTDTLLEKRAAIYDEKLFLEAVPVMKIIQRTDRLAPMNVSKRRIQCCLLRDRQSIISQCNQSHYEDVLRWANTAAKVSRKQLLETVEDQIY